jgi:UDP-2-acetamido-3-amino-2,3-dideoxy-glucuronate N-acetyltransferase
LSIGCILNVRGLAQRVPPHSETHAACLPDRVVLASGLVMRERFFVHPSAEIADDAWVGAGAKIWHQAQILSAASIGEGTIVGKGAFVDRGVRVGARAKIQNYALLYRGAVLDDEVFVGPHAIMANDRYPRAANPDGSRKTDRDWTVSQSVVHRGASIGAGSILLPGVEVGINAMVGAGALVTADIPAHALVFGSPARFVAWVCLCGGQLDDRDLLCPVCSRAYRRVATGLSIRRLEPK